MKKNNSQAKSKSSIFILNCRVDCFTKKLFVDKVTNYLSGQKSRIIVTPNPEIILLSQTNHELQAIINDSDLSLPDGVGLQWASAYLSLSVARNKFIRFFQASTQLLISFIIFIFSNKFASSIIPERVTGTDFVQDIARECSNQGKSIYLLGAGPGVAKLAARNLQNKYSKLIIAGCNSMDWLPEFEKEIIEDIKKSKADCLLIAYGAPRQEKWIARNISYLPNLKLAIGIGGAFDFIAGRSSVLGGPPAIRASKFWRVYKLEWLHRLFTQPNRIKRIFQAIIIFPFKVFLSKIKQ